jgi:hypothetical protein
MSFTERADALLDRISPILANASDEMQGAVLADLTAIWIAGHRVPGDRAEGDRAEGDRFREELIELHAKHVRELVAMYLDGVDG